MAFRALSRSRVARGLGWWLNFILASAASWFLFAMMQVTLFDVGGRFLFNSPMPAATELISLMMAAVVFCALPHVCLREAHVTIDLFDAWVPARVRRLQRAVVSLVSTAALVLIAWRLFELTFTYRRYREVTNELFLPVWPYTALMSALCLFAAGAQLQVAWGYMTRTHNAAATPPISGE